MNLLFLEIDDGFAFAVHGDGAVRPLVVHEVAAVAVHLADSGIEVVHVAFHDFEDCVVRAAVLATAVVPAGELLSHVVGCYDVLPFDAFGALGAGAVRVLAGAEVAGTEVDVLFIDVLAVAVEGALEFTVVDAA